MTTVDIVSLLGYLVASWVSGFAGGYLLSVFRRAASTV